MPMPVLIYLSRLVPVHVQVEFLTTPPRLHPPTLSALRLTQGVSA